MPEGDELRAARVARSRVLEDFFRLHIEEAQAHGAMAHKALEVADAAAPAVILLGSVVTTECPPSQTPEVQGYRPNPIPLPSVHTRMNRSRCPWVAAIPAAMASASLQTRAGTGRRVPNGADKVAWRLNPFAC